MAGLADTKITEFDFWSVLRAFTLAVLALMSAPMLHAQSPPRSAAIAYVSGTTLTFADASGRVLERIPLGRKITDFDLSPNRKLLVAAAADTTYGGPLELFNFQTRKWTTLTHGRLYFHHLYKGEREVYADPSFSPDGTRVVFAIHVNSPGDGNDVIDASGPLAVMNLKTRQVTILKATTHVEGPGSCFSNTPRWSPNGQRILYNCEDGALVLDADGHHLKILPIGTSNYFATGLGWLGNQCILYVRAKDLSDYPSYEARYLNLSTGRSADASQLLPGGKQTAQGLMEASPVVAVQRFYFLNGRKNPPVYLVTAHGKIDLPEDAATLPLNRWTNAALPAACGSNVSRNTSEMHGLPVD